MAPSTFRGYESVVRAIGPYLGDVRLCDLTPFGVERMTAAIVHAGRTARTADMARKVLRLALRQAIRDGLVVRNVAAEARPPRVEPYQARTLTADEARRLIASTTDDELGPLWAVLVATGLRQGEALGLAWSDVDTAAGTLTVRRALTRIDGCPQLGPPSRPAVGERSRYRPLLATPSSDSEPDRTPRAPRPAPWQNADDLVFTDAVGRPLVNRYITPALRAALSRAGLPAIRCHDLRHTAATLQLAAGVPLSTISRTLGHSTLAITADTYAAVTPELRRDAADAMDRALR